MRFKEFLNEEIHIYPKLHLILSAKDYSLITEKPTNVIQNEIVQLGRDIGYELSSCHFDGFLNNVSSYLELKGHYTLKEEEEIVNKMVKLTSDYFKAEFYSDLDRDCSVRIVIQHNIPEGTIIEADSDVVMNFSKYHDISLKDIHKKLSCTQGTIIETYALQNITSNALGLMMIKGCKNYMILNGYVPEDFEWITIIQRHMRGDRDVLDCQEELIRTGFKEIARL